VTFFALDLDVVAPEGHAHDRLHDLHAAVQVLQVLGLVGGAQHVGVGGVGLFGRHLVAEAGLGHEGRHLGAAAEFVDEGLVQPGFVDLQARVGQQAVAVEALDVVALEGAAVAPDVDVVVLHRGHQHGAGHGAAQRRGVEVGDAGGGDVEGAALQRGDALGGQLRGSRPGGPFRRRTASPCAESRRSRLVGLAQVGGVGVGNRALVAHPVQRGAGVESAGEGDADLLADGEVLENGGHGGAAHAFHGLGCAGAEGQRGRQHHTDGLAGAVGQVNAWLTHLPSK
jgi:hypothetical protein